MPPEPRTDELTAAGAPGSLRARTFQIIFEHDTIGGRTFDVVLFVAILASVLAVMLESVASVRDDYGRALLTAEWCFTAIFSLEYVLRLWCVQQPRTYARSFFGVIDLLAVLPTYVSLAVPGGQVLMAVRILRIMRIFRVLKLTRYVGEASLLGDALRASRFKISVFLLGVLSIVVIVGSVMYLIEGPASGFTSIPKGVYWGIVTLTTVGFGDIAPVTPLGQALAAIVMIMGYGIIAVPTGIVTAELTRLPRGEQPDTVVCSACGTREPDAEARFCRRCGTALDGRS